MTDWENMEPKERDRLVAEEVMGWEPLSECDAWHPQFGDAKLLRHNDSECEHDTTKDGWYVGGTVEERQPHYNCAPGTGYYQSPNDLRTRAPSFTTEIEAAWKVVEEMRDEDYTFHHSYAPDGYAETYWVKRGERHGFVDIVNGPEAICLAALRAKGVDV